MSGANGGTNGEAHGSADGLESGAVSPAGQPRVDEPPVHLALVWPPCQCVEPDCPLKGAPNHRREYDGSDSELLRALRLRIHEDYLRRQRFGDLGRSL